MANRTSFLIMVNDSYNRNVAPRVGFSARSSRRGNGAWGLQ
jgi:hypothetical protein